MAPVFFHELGVGMILTMLMYILCTLRSLASFRLDLEEKSTVLDGGMAGSDVLHPVRTRGRSGGVDP